MDSSGKDCSDPGNVQLSRIILNIQNCECVFVHLNDTQMSKTV